jgi:hypothetical protein
LTDSAPKARTVGRTTAIINDEHLREELRLTVTFVGILNLTKKGWRHLITQIYRFLK